MALIMAGDTNGGVCEVKFPLHADQVVPVMAWMRGALRPDPHGGGEFGDGYLVQSVYLDTPDFDVFHKRGSYGRAKFRIRRYGVSPTVFLERKLKRGGVVRKRRIEVPDAAIARLGAAANGAGWPGAWFHYRIQLRTLQPVVRMSYRRLARFGETRDGPIRVTLDREVRAQAADGSWVPGSLLGDDLLQGMAVLEVKCRDVLPVLVKGLVEELGLAPGSMSKYRLGVRRCGLVHEPMTAETGGRDAGIELV